LGTFREPGLGAIPGPGSHREVVQLLAEWGLTCTGGRPGLATFASVNLLLPALAVALGLAHARIDVAWLGASAMTLDLTAGLAARYAVGDQWWSLDGLLGAFPPVLAAACMGYAALGTSAALARGPWRRRASTPQG
jgi:hypothetical protein